MQSNIHAPGSVVNNVGGDQYNNNVYLGINNTQTGNTNSFNTYIVAGDSGDSLPYAKVAGYDPAKGCLEGTRTELLNSIYDWVDDPAGTQILWIHGVAGSGKSAVSNFLADHYNDQGQLGSSFCFDRAHQESRRPNNLFSTIAQDLASKDHVRMKSLLAAVENDKSLRTSLSPNRQFQGLLVDVEGTESLEPLVVIIDALDESTSSPDRSQILSILSQPKYINKLPLNFRIIVTSRREEDIVEALDLKDHVAQRNLQQTPVYSIEQDIRSFILSQIGRHRSSLLDGYVPGWCDILVKRSGGLFQWAATACAFIIGRGEVQDYIERYHTLLSVDRGLFNQYFFILDRLYPKKNEHSLALFKEVVSSILAAKEPLTSEMLKSLSKNHAVDIVLPSLTSLFSVGSAHSPITPLHTSIRDFLTSPSHSHHLFIDLRAGDTFLAISSLTLMKRDLKFNIRCLRTSYLPNIQQIDSLSQDISTSLAYACRYWTDHLSNASSNAKLSDLVMYLLHAGYLYWLEVMSLLGWMTFAERLLQNVSQWCYLHDDRLSSFAQDATKFVAAFAAPIALSVPHIYLSALPLAPSSSLIARHYLPRYPNTIYIKKGTLQHWPSIRCVMTGHNRHIKSVAFSPDGTRIVSGSDDRTVRIWDALTGEQLGKPLVGHEYVVNSVAFSPDGTRIVSGSDDSMICTWDASTGEQIGESLTGHEGPIRSVAFSPDGTRIVSGSDDRTIRIWDVSTGEQIGKSLAGHEELVFSVAFSPDSARIVSGSGDRTIRIWDASTGKQIVEPLAEHYSSVYAVAFSPDGTHIVSGSDDRTIRIWDALTGEQVGASLEGHEYSIQSVAFSHDGTRIVSGSKDTTIRIWNAVTREQVGESLVGHEDLVRSVAFSPDDTCIVSGSYDMTIRTWDAFTGVRAGESPTKHDGPVNSVSFSPNGNRIVSASNDQTIRIWDVSTGEQLGDSLVGHEDIVISVAFSLDGTRIVSGSVDGTIRIWDVSTGEQIGELLTGHEDYINSIAFSQDGARIVSGSNDETIRIWDVLSGEQVGESLVGHGDSVRSVAFSPDGTRIVSGSDDRTIRIWDVSTGEQIEESLVGHTLSVNSVAFSPDGTRIVSGSNDQTIRIWDASTGGQLTGSLAGHQSSVDSVAFSPNGTSIVSGSYDSTIRIWDATTGKQIEESNARNACSIKSASFSSNPTGTRIVSRSDECTRQTSDILITHITPEQLLNQREFDDDGWFRGPQGELLLWLPPFRRKGFPRPRNTCVIGGNSTYVDYSRFVYGPDWEKCNNR